MRRMNRQWQERFQSTPSVGRATNAYICWVGDLMISIHALRGEGDHIPLPMFVKRSLFQSTPSVGRATFDRPDYAQEHIDFNPRPPWGGRRHKVKEDQQNKENFNPRPPWGGRPTRPQRKSMQLIFQSTPSVGRATLTVGASPPVCIFQSTPSVGRATTHQSEPLALW